MEVLILICGIVLILMSLVLLLLSPVALIGILAGVLIIVFRKKLVDSFKISRNKSEVIFDEEKEKRRAIYEQQREKRRMKREAKIAEKERIKSELSYNHLKQSSSEPIVRKFSFVERIPVTGVSSEVIKPFWIGENDIERESVMLYERGDKIFRNIYSFDAAAITVAGNDVLVNGVPFGRLVPKNLETYEWFMSSHPDAWLSLEVSFGHYAKIVRNPDYDREFDDESERNMVEYDCLDKPRATLSIHYTTERSYL